MIANDGRYFTILGRWVHCKIRYNKIESNLNPANPPNNKVRDKKNIFKITMIFLKK